MTTPAENITALLASNLRRYREHSGKTQARLGREAGLTQEAISLIEAGDCHTPMPTAARLAAALGVPVRALLTAPECDSCGDLSHPGYMCMACGKAERRAS